MTKTQNSILAAAFILFLSGGANAVLGIVKNRLLAGRFGVSDDLALFYTADRIPSLVYSVLVLGALSTIFIPIFTEELKKNKHYAYKAAGTLITAVMLFFLLIGGLTWIYASPIIGILGVGKFSPDQVSLGAAIMRIMIGSQMLLVAGSLASSILQSYKQFLMPALAPLAYNFGMIGGILFFPDSYGILGPAYGTLIGAFLHLVIQLPFIGNTGFKLVINTNLQDRAFAKIVQLAPPRIMSVLITNALATINNSLAILISSSAVVYLKFGMQLQSFPVTLFGASMATASLPTLSTECSIEDRAKFKKIFLTSLHQMTFLVMPASAVLLVLRIPVVRLVFGVDNFPWDATVNTGLVLGILTLSIFPQSANYLISRAFYALKDTVTPVKVSLVTIIINVALSTFFIKQLSWGVWAVAISFVITSFMDMLALMYYLSKKTGGFAIKSVTTPFLKITLATFLMAITLFVPIKLLDQVIFDTTRTINLILLTGIATLCGAIVYLLFTSLFKIKEIELFYKLLRKLNFKKIPQRTTDIEPLQ